MKNVIAAMAFALLATSATAQTPTPAAAPGRGVQAPLQIPNPRYETVSVGIQINAPAAKVWARVGKFCDIAEVEHYAEGCRYLSGNGGPRHRALHQT